MVEAIIKRVLDTVRSNRNVEIISVKNDYSARFIEAVIAVDGKPIRIEPSCAVTIEAKRIDGFSKAFMGSVNADGTVKVPITQWMLEIPNTSVEASINVSTTVPSKLSTCNFFINVQDTPHKGDEISPDDPDYDVLAQVLAGEAERVAAEALRESKEAERVAAEQIRQEKEAERTDQKHLFSNALKKKKSGAGVSMTDISPLEKTLDVRARSKNLIPYPFYNTNAEADGITITDNGDGSLTFNGTAKSKVYCYLLYSYTNMFKRGTYILSGMPTKSGAILRFECYKDGVYGQGVSSTENGAAITLTDDYNQFRLFVSIDSGVTVSNLTVYPQLELGTVATARAPYIPDISVVKVKKMGKNLIPYPYVNTTKTLNGITFTDNGDGSITINGTATADAYFTLASKDTIKTPHLAAGSYTISGHNSNIIINATKNGSWWFQDGTGAFNEGDTFTGMSIVVPKGRTFNNVTIYPQLEMGAAATEREPYIAPVEYAVNADGTVEGVLPIYPTTTLMTDTAGAVIDVEYNRDINKAFAELYNAIISLGGNV